MMPQTPTQIAPPPWDLQGNGYVFLYYFPKNFVQEQGFLAGYQQCRYKGGWFGTVMLVNYETSGVGPYQELLFVPGRIRFAQAPAGTWSISKIYVSSPDSVWNGIENWGIPKELASFSVTKPHTDEEIIEVSIGENKFFRVHLSQKKFIFPVTTKILPPLKLAQKRRHDLAITQISAHGKAAFTRVVDLKVDSQYFPDVSKAKLLATLAIKDFKMIFPVPEVLKNYFK
ncbi:acetoacetate decarboxylase family protein [Emticicia sp. 17c]|uniref:acetoacetate decarboxylase family protein n=1 Tax=Emticicia sp. 17c TaxID=3127704 RepID=UPI00301C455C